MTAWGGNAQTPFSEAVPVGNLLYHSGIALNARAEIECIAVLEK